MLGSSLMLSLGLSAVLAPAPVPTRRATAGAYVRHLIGRARASRTDCLNVVAIFVGGRRADLSAAGVERLLNARGIVTGGDLAGRDRPATRGFASLLFARAMRENQGVLRTLFSSSEHYAYRHLEYLGLVPAGGSGTRISGPELAGLLSLANRRMAARHSDTGVPP